MLVLREVPFVAMAHGVVQKREVVFIQVVSSSGPSTEVKAVDG